MADTEKILQAIKNQRWFFFSNNDKIIFDRDTALIWTNLNNFPYGPYSPSNGYWEVQRLIDQKNLDGYGGFYHWRIPTPDELWKMIEDTTFPFQEGECWRIKKCWNWCVYSDGRLLGKDLDKRGAKTNMSTVSSVAVILCSSTLVPPNYSAILRDVLDIFTKNNWIPIFNDPSINELYKKLFVDKPEEKIEPPAQKKLAVKFDYKQLLAKYDTAAINKSSIQYFDAVLSLTDELLNVLQMNESANSETIAELLKIALKLNAKYTDNPNLTAEENSLLAERQKYLAKRLELSTDAPKQKILSVKAQAERFFERLDKINDGDKSIRELAELQAEPRADFELLVENLARIINNSQHKVEFFVENKNFVANVVKSQSEWSDNYKSFKTSLREELSAACRNDSIEDEIFSAWYDDWQTKRFAIEQRFLPLVEFGLKGNFSDAFDGVLKILSDYRDAVDKFYLHERKNIYQKFAFTAGGDLQEKFETESELYKLAERLQRDLQGIIFSRDKTEDRIFLLRWSEPLLNLPIDEISQFIVDKELDEISSEVLTSFAELRSKNFAEYLADSKIYSDAAKKREKEFNALIFRMRKDLRKA